jgi:hypothetical protein
LVSCAGRNDFPERALVLSGANRPELEKVLNHYKQHPDDYLKYKAACFLIENMDVHFSYENKYVNEFCDFMRRVSLHPAKTTNSYFYLQYDSAYNAMKDRLSNKVRKNDLESITADYLIHNIDKAFEYWDTPWAKHLSFDIFCRHILPYRSGREPLSAWRDTFIEKQLPDEKFRVLLEFEPQSNYTHLYALCQLLNRDYKVRLNHAYRLPEMKLSELKYLEAGTCSDYSYLLQAKTRSMGIPVAIDYVHRWGNFGSTGHEWNVLIPSEGLSIPFGPMEEALGIHLIRSSSIAKVYRKTFEKRPESLYMQLAGKKRNEKIPNVFLTPCMIDVTREYVDVSDVKVEVPKGIKNRYAYMTVFNYGSWDAIHWGRISGGKARFTDMGKGVVYLPMIYADDSEPVYFGYPFLLRENGEKQFFKPDKNKTETVSLKRKFRYSYKLQTFAEDITGGMFQVAHKPDFSDAVTLYTIPLDECKIHTVNTEYEGDYPYFRVIIPPGKKGALAELDLFDESGEKLSSEKLLMKDRSQLQKSDTLTHEIKDLFDGSILTCYNIRDMVDHWLGIDFRKPVHISKIKYCPRNDDNFIREGELYELSYYDSEGWHSLGQKTGDSTQVLIYNDVPSNALLLLENHSVGKEIRIFTYENGKQVWW